VPSPLASAHRIPLFAGDVLMPYLGVPFFRRGFAGGAAGATALHPRATPRQLIEGHTTPTESFTGEAVAGLEASLTELHEIGLARIGENMTLPDILDRCYLPAVLRDHPAAVVPYLVSREDRGSTRGARRKERKLSTCSPAKRRTPSSPPLPPSSARASSRSPWNPRSGPAPAS